MDKKQYLQAVQNNQDIIRTCLKTNTVNFSDIVFWGGITARELSFDEVANKWPDILSCTVIGALPCVTKHGEDGYLYYARTKGLPIPIPLPIPIETKLCGVHHKDLALGPRGGLYYSANLDNPNSKCAITTHFVAKFSSHMSNDTLLSKKRDTFLILFDRTENCVIDVYGMEGEKVLQLLEQKQNNSSKNFKLSAFQQYGFRMRSGGFGDLEGFDNWETRISKKTTRRIMT